MKIHFVLPVAAFSQAWPHSLWFLLPIWHTQHWVHLFCSVSPDSCISFWPSPALPATYKILSISHFHPPTVIPAQTTAGQPFWDEQADAEQSWSCERDASPWTELAKLCQTRWQQLPTPPGASGHSSRNAFRRHLGMFKDLHWINIVVSQEQTFHRVSAASTKLLGDIGRHRVR